MWFTKDSKSFKFFPQFQMHSGFWSGNDTSLLDFVCFTYIYAIF